MKLPVLYGVDLLEIIPIVLNAFAAARSGSKAEIRTALKKAFLEKFFVRQQGKVYTRKGKLLPTEDEVNRHLEKTWLDCYALPACERFKIIARNDRYQLTTLGLQLLDAYREGHFKNALARLLAEQDETDWRILVSLREFPTGASLSELLKKMKSDGIQVLKEASLRDFVRLFTDLDLIRIVNGLYVLNLDRYQSARQVRTYRRYEDVSDSEFMSALYSKYTQLRASTKSPYVRIEDLRTPVSDALQWVEDYFSRRLEEIPLIVDGKQLLFSPRAFSTKGGVTRKKERKYYNYITIYG